MPNCPKNQNGQTLIIAIFLMVVALSIGISVSTSFFKNLKSSALTDSSSRALAVAEGLIERILIIPQNTLESYINTGSCGADCVLSITHADGIVSTANATLSYVGNNPDAYPITLEVNETSEISLAGYANNQNVHVCWNTEGTDPLPSVTGLFIYGTQGSYETDNYAYNSVNSIVSNGFNNATANFGYNNCFTVTGRTSPVTLRLRPLYSDVDVFIVPAPANNIPVQGILIRSVGRVGDVTRTVEVIKSFTSAPTVFDYVLYQKTSDIPLSN